MIFIGEIRLGAPPVYPAQAGGAIVVGAEGE
jgi:hypothetical protein